MPQAFLTLFIPLAFGGSEPWGLFIFNLTCIAFSASVLFKRKHFALTPVSKAVLSLLGFIILLACLQLLNQHNFLQKPSYLPFTLCRYYSLEGLSLLFSVSMLYLALTQIVQHSEEVKNLIYSRTGNNITGRKVAKRFFIKKIKYLLTSQVNLWYDVRVLKISYF